MSDSSRQKKSFSPSFVWLLFHALFWPALHSPASGAGVTDTNLQSAPFAIHWPLLDPSLVSTQKPPPLLTGSLQATVFLSSTQAPILKLQIFLTRPHAESNRLFWNQTLAFPQYDWMRYVRVWDTNQQWLWPNLPMLLRLYGNERVERYGGWDPGKEIDNDFAGVLIRKYDATGETESSETQRHPLVSAEWHPVGINVSPKETVVHSACSDEFTIHLADPNNPIQARPPRIVVWLIYADFMGAPVPRAWPKEPEFNGGILAYFQIDWREDSKQGWSFQLNHLPPRTATGFDWRHWVGRTSMFEKAQGVPRVH